MKFKLPGVYQIDHLKDPWPWTAGLSGMFYWFAWDPKKLFGISKAEWQRRIIDETIQLYEKGLRDPKEIGSRIEQAFTKQKTAAKAVGPFDFPAGSSLISTDEAVRRVRLFSEDYLNKELDVFLSLLPDYLISSWFAESLPTIRSDAKWSVYGHSGDITTGIGMVFMQVDTLAYSHNTSALVALEQKIDADFEAKQFLKYCFMAAYFEHKELTSRGTRLYLLLMEPSPSEKNITALRRDATTELDGKNYPCNNLPRERAELLVPRVRELVASADFAQTTWQKLGDHFSGVKNRLPADQETIRKLIDGLLESLRIKRSKKLRKPLFVDSPPHSQPR